MRLDLAINGMVLGFFKNGKIPIMREGTQWRPFIHVKDTSKAFLNVIEAEDGLVNKQVFNVGSDDQNFQIFPLAEIVADAMGMPFNYEWYGSADNRSYKISFAKIKRVLGFEPDYTPKEGAREIFNALKDGALNPDDPRMKTVDWYKRLLETNPAEVKMHGEIL